MEGQLAVDDISFAPTETSSEFSGGVDHHAEFQLHERYANRADGGEWRREALAAGSMAYSLAMVSLRGDLRPPHPDEHLDCADQRMPLADLLELYQGLKQDPDLRSMDVSGNLLGILHPKGTPPPRPPDGHGYPTMPAMEGLADALKENSSLTRLNISRNFLGDLGQQSLVKLMRSLHGNQRLVAINLAANGLLGPEGNRFNGIAEFCRRVMPTLTSLIHLDLSHNELHSEALKMLAESINLPSLLCVDVSHNRVSEEPRGAYDASGWHALCTQLQQNQSLTCLLANDNRLGNAEASSITQVAAQMPKLKALHLSDNLIHASGASGICDNLFADEHLEMLILSGNPLTDEGGLFISKMLSKNTCIHTLGIARCGLSQAVCKSFDDALVNNITITSLDFHDNDVHDQRVRYVIEAALSNRDLQVIRQSPLKYDYAQQSHIIRRQLLKKIHHLDAPNLRLLLSNKSFVNDELMHKRLLELLPPNRHKLVFSGKAMAKTAGADWRHVRAVRFIQRTWRMYKKGYTVKYSMADIVEIKLRQFKDEFMSTYGEQGWEKEKRRRRLRFLQRSSERVAPA